MAKTLMPVEVMDKAVQDAADEWEERNAADAWLQLEEIERHFILRAAIRALAAQFRDPVVVNALLWAAAEGEVKAHSKPWGTQEAVEWRVGGCAQEAVASESEVKA